MLVVIWVRQEWSLQEYIPGKRPNIIAKKEEEEKVPFNDLCLSYVWPGHLPIRVNL